MFFARWLWRLGGAVVALQAQAAIERISVEVFARESKASHMSLSPDGRRAVFLGEQDSRTLLYVLEIDTGKLKSIDPGLAMKIEGTPPKEFVRAIWVSNDRILATTTANDRLYGMLSVRPDSTGVVGVAGWEDGGGSNGQERLFETEVVHRFFDENGTVLMLDRYNLRPGNPNRPALLKVGTSTGFYEVVERNPGEVIRWGIDGDGVARFGVLRHGEQTGAIYRAKADEAWRTVLPLKRREKGEVRPVFFDPSSGRILVQGLTDDQHWTLFPMNPEDGTLGPPLLTDPVYDIVPDQPTSYIGDIQIGGVFYSRAKKTLAGLLYHTESPRMKWFDRDYLKYQKSVDTALKDTMNFLVDESADGTRQLWSAFSDQNPGAFFLLDTKKPSFTKVADRMPWIKPSQMAVMRPFTYQTRDGLTLHGYLTLPPGYEPKGLPLVVKPHGGPWARDVWSYDPLNQLLANRGFAVLQMNYRGSIGYGKALADRARKQIGGEIQNDIEDATQWAIKAGVADPQRIAIMGMSYGGYSALFGLGKSPGLYRCGISIAGVTDWLEIYADSDVSLRKEARRYWTDQIGDPRKEADRLRAISPVNFADEIKAPVLIIQGKEDNRVPDDQARAMVSALKKAGRPPAEMMISGLGHSMGNREQRLRIYTAVVEFLEKHLGPGVP